LEAYRRNALIAAFGELPDKELQCLGRGLEAHHVNSMANGNVVLLPAEIHKVVHTLTQLGGNAYASGETDNAQVLIECAQMLLAQFTIK
jgi:hypothetical protein